MHALVALLGLTLIGSSLIMAPAAADSVFHSPHFTIHNTSGATTEELQIFAATLEGAYTAVAAFLGKAPPSSIGVWLEDRRAIPRARNGNLYFYRDRGRIQDEAAAYELVHLTTNVISSPAIEEGLAVYVAESLAPKTGNLFPQYAQPVDAWVDLFRHQGTLVPLEKVLDTTAFAWNLDGSPDDTRAWQTYLEAGSLVRWIVESKGWEVFWRVHQTRDVVPILGTTIPAVEYEWLQHIAGQAITPRTCRDVLPQSVPRLRLWCAHAEPTGSASPAGPILLPPDVQVVPPEVTVSTELAAYSGQWSGTWDGVLPHLLVVEQISPPHAMVIYATGMAPQWGIDQASWGRVQGDSSKEPCGWCFNGRQRDIPYAAGWLAGGYLCMVRRPGTSHADPRVPVSELVLPW